MSKRKSAKYKLDRRMGENIWGRPNSPVNRRSYGPGQHGQRRKGKWYPDLKQAQVFASSIGAGFLERMTGRFVAYPGTRLEAAEVPDQAGK